MRQLIWFFTICFLFACAAAYGADDAGQDEKLIKEAKEKITAGEFKVKVEALDLIRKIGPERFVETYVTEEEQGGLVEDIVRGSSPTEGSMVRSDVLVALLDSKYEGIRVRAAEKLSIYAIYTDQPEAVKKLFALMESKDSNARRTAINTIGTIVEKNAIEARENQVADDIIKPALKHLDDEDGKVVSRIILLYPDTRDKKIIRKLKKLVSHKDPNVRRLSFAFFANNEIFDKDIRKAALKTISDEAELPGPQNASSRYLGIIKEREAIPLMGKLLEKYAGKDKTAEDKYVMWLKGAIPKAIQEIGSEEGLKYCIDLAQSDEPLAIIAKAGVAIQSITGKDLGYELELVPSQKLIADKKLRVWYIKDYVKEGDKRKEELTKLEEEIDKLENELRITIIIEKILYTGQEFRKEVLMGVDEADIEKIVEEASKLEERRGFIRGLASTTGDADMRKKAMKIVVYFLDDEDEEVQLAAIYAVTYLPQFVDAEPVTAKLESIYESGPGGNRIPAAKAITRLKALKPPKDTKPEKEERPKQEEAPQG